MCDINEARDRWTRTMGPIQGKVLTVLCDNAGEIVSMATIWEEAYGCHYSPLRDQLLIRKQISSLRARLGEDAEIQTCHYRGYALVRLESTHAPLRVVKRSKKRDLTPCADVMERAFAAVRA